MLKRLSLLLLIVATVFCTGASAQNSSINTFSPYTFYGIGDFSLQGSASQRSMGGAGVAYRSNSAMNLLNPAALANTGRRSVLFNVGLEGSNVYSQSDALKSSYNTFNIRNIALQLSVYNGMAMRFSMSPLTEVGYRVRTYETDPEILTNIGLVEYLHEGEGGISQFKFEYGLMLSKHFNLGAEVTYYHGSTTRTYSSIITPTIQPSTTNGLTGVVTDDVSRVMFGFGTQISPILTNDKVWTIAAAYKMGGDLKPKTTRDVQSNGVFVDTVLYSNVGGNMTMPGQLTVGTTYQTTKFSVSADYMLQNWAGLNPADADNGVDYYNNNTLKIGAEYVPDRGNIRSFFRRVTYRLGFHTGNYYVQVRDHKITDQAITFGFGIPVKFNSYSMLNLGAELGKRGITANGLVKENYVRLSVGLSLFGEDYWFVKPKYD